MKKIVVVVGSPRRNGNTETLANAFIKGAEQSGNSVEKIVVSELNINCCNGCNYCFTSENHQCCQKDDMQMCYDKFALADAVVFATPIYFYNVSAQLKCFIDRFHNPIRNSFKFTKLGLLAVCADSHRPQVFDSTIAMYNAVLSYFSLENGGVLTVSGVAQKGDIMGNPALIKAEQMGKDF